MTEGTLAQTMREAIRIYAAMRADGASLADCRHSLERTLRVVWPFTREWKYLCVSCEDRGLVMGACSGDATCGRTMPHYPHDYGTPCWCEKGAKFKPKAPTADDFVTAGKSKPRTFSRFGR